MKYAYKDKDGDIWVSHARNSDDSILFNPTEARQLIADIMAALDEVDVRVMPIE